MRHPSAKTSVAIALVLASSTCLAQEWVKPGHPRSEYVQDRIACTSDAQLMLLSGPALDREVEGCLMSKGWQQTAKAQAAVQYCADMPVAISCKSGASEAIYKADRAVCFDHVLATVGNRYSQPGWWGLGGLIVSAIRAQENKTNLERTQLLSMKICLEARGWTVTMKGAAKDMIEPGNDTTPEQTPTSSVAASVPAPSVTPPETAAEPPRSASPIVRPVALTGESKYMFAAERFAKSQGCESPVASMNVKAFESETFSIACANGDPLVVRCEGSACRALQ